MSPNLKAFLDTETQGQPQHRLPRRTLAASGRSATTSSLGAASVQRHTSGLTLSADHVWLPRLNIASTAAGRYQLLEALPSTQYKVLLKLSDFSQGQPIIAIAVQQIKASSARWPLVESGDFAAAAGAELRISEASLPMGCSIAYGQHENTVAVADDGLFGRSRCAAVLA